MLEEAIENSFSYNPKLKRHKRNARINIMKLIKKQNK